MSYKFLVPLCITVAFLAACGDRDAATRDEPATTPGTGDTATTPGGNAGDPSTTPPSTTTSPDTPADTPPPPPPGG